MNISEANSRRLWAYYVALLLCWGLGFYALLFTWIQEGTLFSRLENGQPYLSDFVKNYEAGQLSIEALKSKGAVNIYDPEVQQAHIDDLIAPVQTEKIFFLEGTPSFFICNIPLILTDMRTAWIAFCALGLSASLLSLWLLARSLLLNNKEQLGVIAGAFSSFPLWLAVRLGQFALVLLPSVALFFTALRKRKYCLAGLVTALFTVKPQYLPVLFLIGCSAGGWRYYLPALLSCFGIAMASVRILGLMNVIKFPDIVLSAEMSHEFSLDVASKMQNLRGLLALCMGSEEATVYRISCCFWIASIVLVAVLWRKFYRKHDQRLFAVLSSISITLMLVLSPHTYAQDYALMAIPCALMWSQTQATEAERHSQIVRMAILAMVPVSWVLYLVTLLPIPMLPPFATVSLAFAWLTIWWTRQSPEAQNNLSIESTSI